MKDSFRFFILTAVVFLFTFSSLFAVPPSQEVIEAMKEQGRFDEYLAFVADARSRGVDSPNRDNIGLTKLAAGAPVTVRVLVILIDFPNKPYAGGWTAGSQGDFDSLLFSDGINPTGSMKEFYLENSYGNFNLIGDIAGWYTAANDYQYYTNFCDGSHGTGYYPNNSQRLVEEAIDMADPDVDFSLYDNDGNGSVDGIFVVHSGTGREESGNDCEIHSHKWSISGKYKDGVWINTFSIEPEETSSGQDLIDIGVFCHEFGHVLGIPDFYDTDYSSSGIGRWGLMSGGSYNGGSRRPAHFCAFAKDDLGWLTLTQLSANDTEVEIPAVEYNPVAYRLWKNGIGGSQYFVIENRQPFGFDEELPGAGLLIWHVDENVWGNSNDWHPRLFLEQADGKFDLQNDVNGGDGGDPFPIGGLVPQFHDKTIPDSRDYNSNSTEVAVWNISASDSVMTADFDVYWSRPFLTLDSYFFNDGGGGDGDGILEEGETIELTISVSNDWKEAVDANISLSIDDALLNIVVGTAGLGTIPSGGAANNSLDPLSFEVPVGFAPRIDSFFIEIVSNGGDDVSLMAIEQNVGKPLVLLVDDDDDGDLIDYFSSPIYSLRLPYDNWNVWSSGSPELSDLNKYEAVFWFTGDYRAGLLSAAEITAMQGYLDGGGQLFLSGQGIAEQLFTQDLSFLEDYLKVDYIDQTFSFIPILDTTSGPISAGLKSLVINTSGGAGNQSEYNHILPINGGTEEWKYYDVGQGDDYGAVSYAGGYKSVFFAFGFEAIINGDDRFEPRENVMQSVLDFFGLSGPGGYPDIVKVEIGPGNTMNIVDHTPDFSWDYYDEDSNPQLEYRLQVGSDADWVVAEMWDYGPIVSGDTNVEYAGLVLEDAQNYFFRVQAFNGIQWSNWMTLQFRMNSVPGMVSGMIPDLMAGVTAAQPELRHVHAFDTENDYLTYSYEVYSDAGLTNMIDSAMDRIQEDEMVYWTVSVALADEQEYWWRVQSFDQYERGSWSAAASFWVNSVNSVPAAFNLIEPEDGSVLSDVIPPFNWTRSTDADLHDEISYTFLLSTDPGFSSVDSLPGLTDTTVLPESDIVEGNTYYWKVKAVDNFGGETISSETYSFSAGTPGDANGDGSVNLGDSSFIINYIFYDGPAPSPLSSGDANGDCSVNIGDASYIINYIFYDGPAPVPGCAK